jgi:hypothetical protein
MLEVSFEAWARLSWLRPTKERMSNDAIAREVLSALSSLIVEPAISVFACRPTVLGMAIHGDRMGQAEQHQ